MDRPIATCTIETDLATPAVFRGLIQDKASSNNPTGLMLRLKLPSNLLRQPSTPSQDQLHLMAAIRLHMRQLPIHSVSKSLQAHSRPPQPRLPRTSIPICLQVQTPAIRQELPWATAQGPYLHGENGPVTWQPEQATCPIIRNRKNTSTLLQR